jgi:hypothetical protein
VIRAILTYGKDEVCPRIGAILRGSEFWIAGVLASACGTFGDRWLLGGLKVADAVMVLLTYCAIALGFCVAGLTIALTLPDREFARKLANHHADGRKCDAYSDLLFVFSWTALCHWCSIVVLVLGLILGGANQSILAMSAGIARRVFVGAATWLSTYSFGQFLVTLISISQVGRTYIDQLKGGKTDK